MAKNTFSTQATEVKIILTSFVFYFERTVTNFGKDMFRKGFFTYKQNFKY